MESKIFNKEAFFSHLGGDTELGVEILNVYMVDAPQRADSLFKALDGDDQALTVKFAHALKGISATIRAERLTALAEIVERTARKGELDTVRSYLPQVTEELNRVIELIRQEVGGQ